jgi:hypothetical protein
MSRKIYHHMNRNQLIERFDSVAAFLNLNHKAKTNYLKNLMIEDYELFKKYKTIWTKQKQAATN